MSKLQVSSIDDLDGGSLLTPRGSVIAYYGSSAPSGWLECNGSGIPSDYSDLISLIGSNTPDLRGEFIRGWDHGKGTDSGRTLGSSQTDEIESHTHDLRTEYGTSSVNNNAPNGQYNQISNDDDYIDTVAVKSTGGTETRPRNVALMYIIKT